MKANIEKTFQVEQPIKQVWDLLSNPEQVVSCVPGAQLTEKVDDTNYKGIVSVKFGPVAAKYNGKISLDLLDSENYQMTITGKGMDVKGKGSAGMVMNAKLNAFSPNSTEVSYQMEVSVTGKLAQFGSRLIVDVSNELAEQFVQSFKAELEKGAIPIADEGTSKTEASKPKDNSVNAFALMLALIKRFFSKLFGSSPQANE